MSVQVVNSPFPGAANTGKHNSIAWIIIEQSQGLAPVLKACLAVNPFESEAVFLECLLDQVKHFDPATENDASNDQPGTRTTS